MIQDIFKTSLMTDKEVWLVDFFIYLSNYSPICLSIYRFIYGVASPAPLAMAGSQSRVCEPTVCHFDDPDSLSFDFDGRLSYTHMYVYHHSI